MVQINKLLKTQTMTNYFKQIFEYENWANAEITDAVCGITYPPEKALSIMSHIFNAQIVWLSRIQNTEPAASVWQNYDKINLKKIQNEISDKLSVAVSDLSESDLSKLIKYKNSKGESFSSKLSDILIHLTHHSAYHRGQVILLIKDSVKILPYTDYIHFVRNFQKP